MKTPNQQFEPIQKRARLFGSLILLLIVSPCIRADEPLFGFTYTTDLLPRGKFELTLWSTTRFLKYPGGKFLLQETRFEQEYGLTDKLQLALYETYDYTSAFHNGPFGATTPPEQFSYYQPGTDDYFTKGRFVGISAEIIYRTLSPYLDPVGLAFYEEPTFGPGFIESESKLILQKNFHDDLLVFALNLTYAPEFRWLPDDLNPSATSLQEETDVNVDLGASYRFMDNWSGALEFIFESEFNSYDFNHQSNGGYYLGPTIHYAGEHFFFTADFYEQMPWAAEHTDTVPGSIVGGRIVDNDFEKYRARIKIGWYF